MRDLIEQVYLSGVANQATFRAAREPTLLLKPSLEDPLNLGVTEKLFQKDIDLQRLVLRLPKECLGVPFRIVEVKKLACQLLVMRADRAPIRLVELPQEMKKGEVERRAR